jgi:hypothetical protein
MEGTSVLEKYGGEGAKELSPLLITAHA